MTALGKDSPCCLYDILLGILSNDDMKTVMTASYLRSQTGRASSHCSVKVSLVVQAQWQL